ncbi:hypothetical protein [Actinocorallia sp. A-T 12471]|uniref:hypothetical protein n=1 Tax=Actinocorallia sp. A-T 12471 TaxID=3089813 RepID=UPI0029CB1505|nr:hypothetical protein [Actinocorallia sp. A-T 12471]MDX6744322.1 hypothetical protein [Actinocorallia sp. A-T 12471]
MRQKITRTGRVLARMVGALTLALTALAAAAPAEASAMRDSLPGFHNKEINNKMAWECLDSAGGVVHVAFCDQSPTQAWDSGCIWTPGVACLYMGINNTGTRDCLAVTGPPPAEVILAPCQSFPSTHGWQATASPCPADPRCSGPTRQGSASPSGATA